MATMSPDETLELTESDLGFHPIPESTKAAFSMLRVAALLSDELDRELQESAGLGLSEMLVIVQVMLAGGRLKMADVADTIVVTRGAVTKIVDRLVEAGYLDREPSAEDRRVIYAVITDRAFELVHDQQELFDEITERRLGALLGGRDLHTLHLLIDRLSCDNPGWEPPAFEHFHHLDHH